MISHEGYLGARRIGMDVSGAAVEGFHGRDEHAGRQQVNKEASSHRSDDRKQNKQTICCLYLRARSAYRVQKVLLRGTWMHHSREDGQGHHGARRTDTTRRRRSSKSYPSSSSVRLSDRDRQICTRIDVHVLMPLFEGGQRFIFNPKISNKKKKSRTLLDAKGTACMMS